MLQREPKYVKIGVLGRPVLFISSAVTEHKTIEQACLYDVLTFWSQVKGAQHI